MLLYLIMMLSRSLRYCNACWMKYYHFSEEQKEHLVLKSTLGIERKRKLCMQE